MLPSRDSWSSATAGEGTGLQLTRSLASSQVTSLLLKQGAGPTLLSTLAGEKWGQLWKALGHLHGLRWLLRPGMSGL